MKPTITFLTVLFIAALINLQAHDQIVKRDGESIFCKVSEVSTPCI